jgi:hypothetical protein
MPRRTIAGLLLAAVLASLSAAPGVPARVAAASCSNWTSESTPPSTIRVFRSVSGVVETVDFKAYVKNVLSREWIGSWTTESLRSGALAVKNYAWYQVLHWRGFVADATGDCFDVFDTTRDQVYDPSRTTYASAASAVDATWSTLALKSGRIFPTYYNAGSANEACGANANGWKMYQWGTQACGLAGKSAAQIMTVYYTGVVVTDAPPLAPPPSTPPPTPAPTAVATPSPTPVPATPAPTPTASATSTPSATGAATPTLSPTPKPTTTPTPVTTPAPTPAATQSPVVEQPGGGQSEVVHAAAPPPPPSARPAPIKVKAHSLPASAVVAPTRIGPMPIDDHRLPPGADIGASAGAWRGFTSTDLRVASFRAMLPALLDDLAASLTARLGHRQLALPLLLRLFG